MSKDIRIRVAVVIPRGEEILLVKHVKGDRQYWLIPGGGLQWGETIDDCAKREVKEETNLEIKILKLLFISESVSEEYGRHLINLTFLGSVLNDEEEIKVTGDDRVQEARFVPVEKLGGIELHPPIAPFLQRIFRNNFKDDAMFLGNLWTFSFR